MCWIFEERNSPHTQIIKVPKYKACFSLWRLWRVGSTDVEPDLTSTITMYMYHKQMMQFACLSSIILHAIICYGLNIHNIGLCQTEILHFVVLYYKLLLAITYLLKSFIYYLSHVYNNTTITLRACSYLFVQVYQCTWTVQNGVTSETWER